MNAKLALQIFLLLLFVTFTASSILLIDVTYTIVPFTIRGEPYPVTVNVGGVMAVLAFIVLVILLLLRRKKP